VAVTDDQMDHRVEPDRYVDVDGGRLGIHEFGPPDGPVVLAAHGITANALSFASLARWMPGVRIIAPDLRGRACSRDIAGPWAIGQHAADLIAVADAYRLESFRVLGHSMGAFVAAMAGVRHPDRIERVVLIDGGVAFPAPPDADVDALLTAIIGPAMTRLSMTFPDRDAYQAFMLGNPAVAETVALRPEAAADLAGYLDHDLLTGTDGLLRSSCVLDAIRVDGGAVLLEPAVLDAVQQLTVPGALLWAPRGLMNQTPGLYTAELLAAAQLPAGLDVVQVPDCNHYSIVFSDAGRAAVRAALQV
jgi:pimeloyl-ACP methyl ester carboxylesterase